MSCETFLTGRGDDDNYMGDEKLNRQEKRDDLIRKIQVLMEQNSGIVKTSQLYTLGTVSYTHLTLPTILLV